MIAIIGGGIVGLSIGWHLARAGAAVTILERDEAGHGATWAAAGMLAPQIEVEPGEEQLLQLLLAGREAWPGFVAELEQSAGMAVDYRSEGTLLAALDRDDVERLRFQYDLQRRLGLALEWLSGAEARRREPHLSPRVSAALYSARDHQVDNRKVAAALRLAFLRAGGTLREHCPVEEIVVAAGRVRQLRLAGGEALEADAVVLAAGCWSRAIPGLPEEARPPVRPVKGQMLALRMPASAPLLQHVLHTSAAYLVPRVDGRLLIGASVEERGFDTQLTAGALFDLLRSAWEVLPGIYDLPVDEMWAGLRPGSHDDAPILGESPVAGLILATGHFRNGILLAPLTGLAVSRLILSGELPEVARPFTLKRFAP